MEVSRKCSGCCCMLLAKNIHEYTLDFGEIHLLCEMCADFYLDREIKTEYFKERGIICNDDQDPFVVFRQGRMIKFKSFLALANFIMKPNTNNYLCVFGRFSNLYYSHLTRRDALDDLNAFYKQCSTQCWHETPQKTPENTRYRSNDKWKDKRIRELSEDIGVLEKKRQKLLEEI